MLKFLGCLLILLSSVTVGFYMERSYKEKIRFLQEIIDLINYTRNQIEFFSLPINEIYLSFQNRSKHLTDLITGNVNLIYENFRNQEYLHHYFNEIGKGYKSEQIKLCDYTLNEAQKDLNNLNLDLPKKIKIIRSLSLFIGASLVILLV